MTAISSSPNVTQAFGDTTPFIQAATTGIKICAFISTLAAINLGHEVYKDPSFMNPWSERAAQITWLSPDHVRCLAMGLPMMISGILMNMVDKERAKLAVLNKAASQLYSHQKPHLQ